MLKNIILVAGLCAAFCGCKKEESSSPDKTDYYGCNPTGGFAVNWHLTEYAVNDTSVRIAINDTVRFYTNLQYSWNDSINKTYTTCYKPSHSTTTMTMSGSPYGQLGRTSFNSIDVVPNIDPTAMLFSSSPPGVNYYFWGHRFP